MGMESHAERQVLKHQQRAVARLLDAEWDPIGVYEDDEAPIPGEYESYAWEVLGHLRQGDSEREIAAVLAAIRHRMMDLGPGPEDARAAKALVEWFRATDD